MSNTRFSYSGGLPTETSWTETSLDRHSNPGQRPHPWMETPTLVRGPNPDQRPPGGTWNQKQRPTSLEETWDQAARQEVTSYRDIPPVDRHL